MGLSEKWIRKLIRRFPIKNGVSEIDILFLLKTNVMSRRGVEGFFNGGREGLGPS